METMPISAQIWVSVFCFLNHSLILVIRSLRLGLLFAGFCTSLVGALLALDFCVSEALLIPLAGKVSLSGSTGAMAGGTSRSLFFLLSRFFLAIICLEQVIIFMVLYGKDIDFL